MKKLFLMILALHSLGLSAQTTIPLFVGSYTSSADAQGISVFRFNLSTGLAELSSTAEGQNSSFLAKSQDGHTVYAVSEVGGAEASVSAYAFDGESLSFVNSLPSQGAAPCHVSLSPKFPLAVVSNYSGGSMSAYALDKNGALARQVFHKAFQGSGPDAARQRQSHIHSAFFSPNGKQVFVQDLGADRVYVFDVDRHQGELRLQESAAIHTPPAGGPRHIALNKKGNMLYVLLEMSAELAIYEQHKNGWQLRQQISVNAADFKGDNGAADLKLSPDGRFLYATNRGTANSIAQFSVGKDGLLSSPQVYPVAGKGPRNFTISPDGQYLLVANQLSNEVVIFTRDLKTGNLTDSGNRIDVLMPVCLVF